MGGLEIVEHEVNGVGGCADEHNLENGIVQRVRVVEGPKEVNVSTEVNNQVKELRLERDTGRTLLSYISVCSSEAILSIDIHWRSSSCARESGWRADGTSPLCSHVSMRQHRQVSLSLPNNLKRFIMTTRPWLECDSCGSAATRALVRTD